VLRWWPPWDPAGATPRPTTEAGRVLIGAEANDAHVKMRSLASRGVTHLFRDSDGRYWEHSNPPDRAGTPQLEELGDGEAERRYANRESWGAITGRPSIWSMLRNIWRMLR
jgi:hypothetical protein